MITPLSSSSSPDKSQSRSLGQVKSLHNHRKARGKRYKLHRELVLQSSKIEPWGEKRVPDCKQCDGKHQHVGNVACD